MILSKKKQFTGGILLSYLQIGLQLLIGLVYTPIVIKKLGASEYGIYSLCISFTGYLTIFDSAVNAAYVRFYVQSRTKKKDISDLNGMFAKIFIFLSLIGIIAGLLLGYNSKNIFGNKLTNNEYSILSDCFYILAFTVGSTIINCIFSSIIIANEKFIISRIAAIVNSCINPLIVLPLLGFGHGAITIMKVHLCTSIIMTIFNGLFCKFVLKEEYKFTNHDNNLLKKIIIFSSFIVVQSIMDQFNWQIDKIIIAFFRGSKEVSVYSVGSQFNSYYLLLISSLSSVFIAEINRLVANKDELRINQLFIKSSRLFAFVAFYVMIAYCIFGKEFIARWVGADYQDSFYVGLLLMLPVTISLTQSLGQDIARAKNLHKIQILINFGICIINVFISIPLAKKYGAIGSAFGTFLSEILICIVVQNLYYRNILKIDMTSYWKSIITISKGIIVPIMFGLIMSHFKLIKQSYTSIFLWGITYTCIYILSIWKISMNNEEKHYICIHVHNK